MIPAVSDIPFTPEASFYIAHKLMKRGAKIYLFKDGFHHSKVMMVDSTFCTVGTANLNSRSLRYDYETNAFIFDPSTTNQLNSMFERDKNEQYLAHARDVEKALRLEKVSRLGRKSADSFPVNLIAQIFNIPRTLPTFGKAFNK